MTKTYRLADINIAITPVHREMHDFLTGYETENAPDFSVEMREEDIRNERQHFGENNLSAFYMERLALYRKIAEKLPFYDVFLFHGSAVAVDGKAYIFTARSGTGKSTHTRLWRELLGEKAVMVNDDKPLIRVDASGTATVYGTPWNGKHQLSRNIAVPVRAICLLERAEENRIEEITEWEALPALIGQMYRPADAKALEKTLDLIDLMKVGLYRLGCNMDISAARLSYQTMKE